MASGSTARPRVFNGDAQNACWEGWEVYTADVTLVPPAQHVHRWGTPGPPLSGSANLDVLAPDSTLREEFGHWRLQEDHFGWAASSDILHRLADSLVGRRILPHARRQRKVKNDGGPFKGMAAI